MTGDLSKKTVCFYDLAGSYTHLAEAVAPSFGRLLYFTPWERGFPVIQEFVPGLGLPAIERITDFEEHLDEIDLAVFPDCGLGGFQEWLRRQGMLVLGSGNAGLLERDRWLLHGELRKVGIEIAKSDYIVGVTALRLDVEKRGKCHIKCNLFRGNMETQHPENYETFKTELDHIEAELGPLADTMGFVVEEDISDDNCVEVGFDDHFGGASYAGPTLWGYERKDKGYLGFAGELPARLDDLRRRTARMLRPYGYSGPCSIEVRITPERDVFLDLTARYPSPPSEIYPSLVRNLAEVMWGAASGHPVAPDFAAPIAAQLVICSKRAGEGLPVLVEVGMPARVVLHGHFRVDGHDCLVCPSKIEECAAAVGLGNSVEDAFAEAIEAAHSLIGPDLSFEESALARLVDEVIKGESLGLDWRRTAHSEAPPGGDLPVSSEEGVSHAET